jgi:hypothetical protein
MDEATSAVSDAPSRFSRERMEYGEFSEIARLVDQVRHATRKETRFLGYSLSVSLRDAMYRVLSFKEAISAHIICFMLAIAVEILLMCFLTTKCFSGHAYAKICTREHRQYVHAETTTPSAATPAPPMAPLPLWTVRGFSVAGSGRVSDCHSGAALGWISRGKKE